METQLCEGNLPYTTTEDALMDLFVEVDHVQRYRPFLW